MQTSFSSLHALIQADKLDQVIDILSRVTRSRNPEMQRKVIQLGARLSANQNLQIRGLMSPETAMLEHRRIIDSVLHVVEEANEAGLLDITLEALEPAQQAMDRKKILFVASNPINTPTFELEKEFLQIRKVFHQKRDQFEVVESFQTTLQSFFDVVRNEEPDILHIACPSSDEYMVLHREDNTIQTVRYDFLAAAFSMFKPYVKCVFLNTWCSPIFMKYVSRNLGCVLGSRQRVSDTNSILFSSGFYTAVAQGSDYEEAYLSGMEVLKKRYQEKTTGLLGSKGYMNTFDFFQQGVGLNKEVETPDHFPVSEPEEIMKIRKGDTQDKD